jgi:hypothetical protein
MNAIVPLNITALRVNYNDNSNVVTQFAGQTADFGNMPYGQQTSNASTGDQVFRSLVEPKPKQPLGRGIHLHWELPDYFRQGVQSNDGGTIEFPHVPNRWLIVRHFSYWDALKKQYKPAESKCWVLESDYLSDDLGKDDPPRPRITVPLPLNPEFNEPPFKYMGRVQEYKDWDPNSSDGDYLSKYLDQDNNPFYLTSVGFVGPAFSAYYPECCSVFGFWDHFADKDDVFQAIRTADKDLKFKVGYQVIGWIQDSTKDPLQSAPGYQKTPKTFAQVIQEEYNKTVQQYKDQQVDLADLPTPEDVFNQLAARLYKWSFPKNSFTLVQDDTDKTLKSVDAPARTLCAGIMQEIVWDMGGVSATAFLSNSTGGAMWSDDEAKIGVGNTPTEALSALLKMDSQQTDNPRDLTNLEYLLDALQLGLLRDLEQLEDPVINLDEALHNRGFSRQSGGRLWIVKSKQQEDIVQAASAASEVTLPLDLAEKLHNLNQAEKDYDQGRAELDARRRQLFMDWYRYLNTLNNTDSFYLNDLPNFIYKSGDCEVKTVVDAGTRIGILMYDRDKQSGRVIAPLQPDSTNSLAAAVWTNYDQVSKALKASDKFSNFELQTIPAPNFWTPTEPVVLIEGKQVEQARRNGSGPLTNLRTSTQTITSIKVGEFSITGDALSGLPALRADQPLLSDVRQLLLEAYFLIPALATFPASALAAQGGQNNPAVSTPDAFIQALQTVQGDWKTGLFFAVRDATPVMNPTATTSQPMALSVTFTNAAATAWAPDAVAWNAQQHYPELKDSRLDPFIPVFLTWKATFDPLRKDVTPQLDPTCKSASGSGSGNFQAPSTYSATNFKQYFQLDGEAIETSYQPGEKFTTANPVTYSDAAVLSRKATISLIDQINKYINDNRTDTDTNKRLETLKDSYGHRRMLAQSLSGINMQQLLRKTIPKTPVENLNAPPDPDGPPTDLVTTAIQNAVRDATKGGDNWYDYGFNAEQPIFDDDRATGNFGPLRAGFLEIMNLRFVDVFGQIMNLSTAQVQSDNALQLYPSTRLLPAGTHDSSKLFNLFLPPRLLTPSRLWFRWLSATHNPGMSDFVEMNAHPSTSPICGWVMPNHLDNSLMFYNDDGAPIGSFGLEHDALTYRTRPGNSLNQKDLLFADIGPPGNPTPGINIHTANLMWFIQSKSAVQIKVDQGTVDIITDNNSIQKGGLFLKDLMDTIESSDQFIHTANYKQAGGLAVLVGRPLAITRAILSLETKGNVLPLHQGDTSTCDPFHRDVANKRYDYKDREQFSSNNIADLQIPLRLGNLSYVDDGLVGFLLEQSSGQFLDNNFYSAAAPDGHTNDVVKPAPDTIQVKPNSSPLNITMLMDPRCDIHATTGLLPVEELSIPPDQYAETQRNLAITFFVHPVLKEQSGLLIPLPEEPGYDWSWIQLDTPETLSVTPPLKTQAATESAHASYTPQTVLEGWLGLTARPNLKKGS